MDAQWRFVELHFPSSVNETWDSKSRSDYSQRPHKQREMVHCAVSSPTGTWVTIRSSEPMTQGSIPGTPFPFISWHLCPAAWVGLSCSCIWWFGFIFDTLRGRRRLPMYTCLESNESHLTKCAAPVLFGEQQFYWRHHHMASWIKHLQTRCLWGLENSN